MTASGPFSIITPTNSAFSIITSKNCHVGTAFSIITSTNSVKLGPSSLIRIHIQCCIRTGFSDQLHSVVPGLIFRSGCTHSVVSSLILRSGCTHSVGSSKCSPVQVHIQFCSRYAFRNIEVRTHHCFRIVSSV